jgi:hypothetical protein
MFPLQVQVQTLPFAASFKYALYTHGYVMVAGYPHFRASQRSTAGQNRHRFEAPLANSQCTAKSSRLEISDAEVLKDHHMMTVFVSDAVLQCLLWGLYEQGKLSQFIKDGDIPNVRLFPAASGCDRYFAFECAVYTDSFMHKGSQDAELIFLQRNQKRGRFLGDYSACLLAAGSLPLYCCSRYMHANVDGQVALQPENVLCLMLPWQPMPSTSIECNMHQRCYVPQYYK